MRRKFVVSLRARPRRVEWDGQLVAPFGETVEVGHLCAVAHGDDDGCEESGATGLELRTKIFDDVGDIPRDGHVWSDRELRSSEEGLELPDGGSVRRGWCRGSAGRRKAN